MAKIGNSPASDVAAVRSIGLAPAQFIAGHRSMSQFPGHLKRQIETFLLNPARYPVHPAKRPEEWAEFLSSGKQVWLEFEVNGTMVRCDWAVFRCGDNRWVFVVQSKTGHSNKAPYKVLNGTMIVPNLDRRNGSLGGQNPTRHYWNVWQPHNHAPIGLVSFPVDADNFRSRTCIEHLDAVALNLQWSNLQAQGLNQSGKIKEGGTHNLESVFAQHDLVVQTDPLTTSAPSRSPTPVNRCNGDTSVPARTTASHEQMSPPKLSSEPQTPAKRPLSSEPGSSTPKKLRIKAGTESREPAIVNSPTKKPSRTMSSATRDQDQIEPRVKVKPAVTGDVLDGQGKGLDTIVSSPKTTTIEFEPKIKTLQPGNEAGKGLDISASKSETTMNQLKLKIKTVQADKGAGNNAEPAMSRPTEINTMVEFCFKNTKTDQNPRVRPIAVVNNISRLFMHASCSGVLPAGVEILSVQVGKDSTHHFNIMKDDEEDYQKIVDSLNAQQKSTSVPLVVTVMPAEI